MKRRSGAGNEAAKGRRQKTLEPKARNAPRATARPKSSPIAEEVARLTRENVGLLSELRECLHQRTATNEVLRLISRSTFDLAKVLSTVLELAAGLSKADKGVILRNAEGVSYYAAATYRQAPDFIESQKGILFEPGRGGVVGRVLLEGKSIQISDVFNDPEYVFREFARRGGFRTILGVPLIREGSPIGLVVLHRAAVKPFSEMQIKLVESFATQAIRDARTFSVV
jgi:two-component system, NtrC family, sensor kinase